MADVDDLARRLDVVERALGLEHEPPLDRLSSIDHRLDSLKTMLQQQGLAIGELARLVNRLEAHQAEHGRRLDGFQADMAETKAGVQAILQLLTREQRDLPES